MGHTQADYNEDQARPPQPAVPWKSWIPSPARRGTKEIKRVPRRPVHGLKRLPRCIRPAPLLLHVGTQRHLKQRTTALAMPVLHPQLVTLQRDVLAHHTR